MTDPAPLRLHTTSTAPNPRRVHIFCEEKGIDLPKVEIDIGLKTHKTEDYIARTGSSHVPALELEDGSYLTESIAICRYLEAFHPDPPLFGRAALEAARIEMWQRRMELYLMIPVAQVFRHLHPSMRELENQVPDWAEVNRPRMFDGLRRLEQALRENGDFVGGPEFSVADITAIVSVDFMRVTREKVPDELTAVLEWRERMHARPSVAATVRRP